ncbi:hypothetical protein PAXINDRAFT_21386 [Paxillus involutus ATCC 200175]|uniref:Uncharacterized protein n=1 Tax=Paxillus involutus ATCC 200175 TaxID=664439 RepID=A0A0C9STC8_PAXIN|nr:hypothetical protein PAXINDRAFT_21386 [Paxillus involutus ATCC 200175]
MLAITTNAAKPTPHLCGASLGTSRGPREKKMDIGCFSRVVKSLPLAIEYRIPNSKKVLSVADDRPPDYPYGTQMPIRTPNGLGGHFTQVPVRTHEGQMGPNGVSTRSQDPDRSQGVGVDPDTRSGHVGRSGRPHALPGSSAVV